MSAMTAETPTQPDSLERLRDRAGPAEGRGDRAERDEVGAERADAADDVVALVDHECDAVRLFAAAVLKERSPREALAVYDLLSTSPIPFVAMSGKYIAEDMRESPGSEPQ